MEFLTDKTFSTFKKTWFTVTLITIVFVLLLEALDKHSISVYIVNIYMWFCLFWGGLHFIGGINILVSDALAKAREQVRKHDET